MKKHKIFSVARLILTAVLAIGMLALQVSTAAALNLPGAATLISPSGNITETTPAYTWNQVIDATAYLLWLGRVNTDGSLTALYFNVYYSATVCSAGICSVTPAEVTLIGGNYRWWVQTSNNNEWGPQSSPLDFHVPFALPGAATLVSPSGSNPNDPTEPSFLWNGVIDATWYYLWVSKVNADGSLTTIHTKWYEAVTACDAFDGCSATLAGVTLSRGKYRWWVQTWNEAGYGPWSSPLDFVIFRPTAAATLVSPSGTITQTLPIYSWNRVGAATWYYLWVSRVTGDGSLTTVHTQWYDSPTVCSASICSVTPAEAALSDGNYRWWVQTWNEAGYGPWSTGLDFSVALPAPPGAAALVSPSGSITNPLPGYTWDQVIDASWYYLWVSKVNADGSLTTIHTKWYDSTVCGVDTCSVTPAEIALGDGNYRWWVQTWNDGGYGPWSSPLELSVSISGFDSQFNGSAEGWEQHSGSWNLSVFGDYWSSGLTGDWASTSYNTGYSTLDYQASLLRTGGKYSDACLVVRGTVAPLTADYDWDRGYSFCYTVAGVYTVWVSAGGSTRTVLQDWTSSPSINIGQGAWNDVRVVANGSNLYLYFNGTLVWSGVDSTLTSGRVGLKFWNQTGVGGSLSVDWATLSTVVPGEIRDTISPEQKALNQAAQETTGNRNYSPAGQP
jgi:hypothetical protein